MKCDTAEQLVLLKQTGELGLVGRFRLQRHLSGCEHCRAFEQDTVRTMAAVRAWKPATDLSERTLTAIGREARTGADRRDQYVFRPSVEPVALWRPLVLYATIALLLFTSWFMVSRQAATPQASPVARVEPAPEVKDANWAWDDDVDETIVQLGSLLTQASDESNGDLDSIARELLNLEAQQI